MGGMSQRVESNAFGMLHARFDQRKPFKHRVQVPRCLVLQSDKIRAKLADRRVQFAYFHATSTHIGLHVF